MGIGAIAISLPFACVIGFLSSMISSTMGRLTNILELQVTIGNVRLTCFSVRPPETEYDHCQLV